MNFPFDRDGPPTPEQLAAYADGELEGCDALLPLLRKVETWLASHPETRLELDEYRRLRRLWVNTAPPLPSEAAWERVLARLPAGSSPCVTRFRSGWLVGGLAAAGLLLAFWLAYRPSQDVLPKGEELPQVLESGMPLAVAMANEIEILRVDGADTHSLVVMDQPLRHPLELLEPGEATLKNLQPTPRRNLVQVRMEQSSRPMVWARVDSEMGNDD